MASAIGLRAELWQDVQALFGHPPMVYLSATSTVANTLALRAVCSVSSPGLGVIHKGNVGKSRTIMAPYLPSAPGGSTPSPYSGGYSELRGLPPVGQPRLL
jgi:hypothetical protein